MSVLVSFSARFSECAFRFICLLWRLSECVFTYFVCSSARVF